MQAVVDEIGRRAERTEAEAGATGASTSTSTSSIAMLPRPPPPRRITFRPIDASTLPDLKALNAALFPVNYGPKVYEQALAAGGISHGAFSDGGRELVGAIMVRLESGSRGASSYSSSTSTSTCSSSSSTSSSLFVSEEKGQSPSAPLPPPPLPDDALARMYVMTVGVLSAWRGQGIGTALLSNALSMASEDENLGVAYLHTRSADEETISFYVKNFGFRRGKTVRNYYRRLDPPDAVVLWKGLR